MKGIYTGKLSLKEYGEADDIIFLEGYQEPLVDVLDWIDYKIVSVRYWITDKKCNIEEATEDVIKQVMGFASACLCARYSEATGYLWTVEDLTIGGHDLKEELYDAAERNKFLILEIETHE